MATRASLTALTWLELSRSQPPAELAELARRAPHVHITHHPLLMRCKHGTACTAACAKDARLVPTNPVHQALLR